jgi:hypothetical protein
MEEISLDKPWERRGKTSFAFGSGAHVYSLIKLANIFCPLWGKKYFRFAGGKAELRRAI